MYACVAPAHDAPDPLADQPRGPGIELPAAEKSESADAEWCSMDGCIA